MHEAVVKLNPDSLHPSACQADRLARLAVVQHYLVVTEKGYTCQTSAFYRYVCL